MDHDDDPSRTVSLGRMVLEIIAWAAAGAFTTLALCKIFGAI